MILSITNGKSGSVAVFKMEGTDDSKDVVGLADRLNGNSNGLDGEGGQVGLWRIASIREPSGKSGGGLAGGGSAGGRSAAC